MICDLVNQLISITEQFPSQHKVIDTYINNKDNKKEFKFNNNLNALSPRGLYRKKGLNITKYKEIMKKNGLSSHKDMFSRKL